MPAKHTPKHTSPTPRPALVTQEEKTPKPEERVSKFARQVFARVRSRLESEWESFLERATMEEQRLMIEILNDYANQTAGAKPRGPCDYEITLINRMYFADLKPV